MSNHRDRHSRHIPSVVERTRPVTAGAPVVAAHFLGETAVFVLGEETLLLVPDDGRSSAWRCMPAPSLATADGRASSPAATTARSWRPTPSGDAHRARHRRQAALDRPRRARSGRRGRLVGRQAGVRAQPARVAERMLEVPSTVGGLAFAPKGFRLAIAHYNGVTLWFPNAQSRAGDARMEGLASRRRRQPGRQVPGHHHAGADAARLAARRGKHMRMSGYARACARSPGPPAASGSPPPARSSSSCGRSRPRTARWASSRACWRRSEAQVEVVACHPEAGGRGGRLCRRRGAAGAHRGRRRGAGPPAWPRAGHRAGLERDGATLAFGTEDGEAGVVALG